MLFGETNLDAPAEPPVFNGFQASIRREGPDLRDFWCGPTNGTIKSDYSIHSLAAGHRKGSSSTSTTLKDLTTSLRTPNRTSLFLGNAGNRNPERVPVPTAFVSC